MLELVNADRLPGQPVATAEMLGEALAGRSPVDSSWWEELAAPRTAVAATSDGEVVGVVSFSTRSRDDAGVLLWLHAREDRTTIDVLLQHVLDELREHRVVEAFSFATALGLGLEALPVRHRPVTAAALVEAGFVGTDLWRYMGRRLPADDLPRVPEVRIEAPEPDVRELTVGRRRPGARAGHRWGAGVRDRRAVVDQQRARGPRAWGRAGAARLGAAAADRARRLRRDLVRRR
nr:hypothetical protein [Amycolatopsis methanolica]